MNFLVEFLAPAAEGATTEVGRRERMACGGENQKLNILLHAARGGCRASGRRVGGGGGSSVVGSGDGGEEEEDVEEEEGMLL